jgi:hypothetical protein
MAITITVEDGSIVAGANSYVSLADYLSYWEQRGVVQDADDEVNKANIVRGFDAINRNWSYRGVEVDSTLQVGAWPRYIPTPSNVYDIPTDTIPQDIIDAQCEMANLIRGGLDPMATFEGAIESEMAKAGPVETETVYMGGKGRPQLTAVTGLLRPYLGAGGGQPRLLRG